MRKYILFFCLAGIFIAFPLNSQQALTWQRPPGAIASIAKAPFTPGVSVSPSGTLVMIMERPGMPSIDDLAGEELRLAGIRFDPSTNSPGRGDPPEKSPVPEGPVVQENLGEKAAVRTFQDLLQNPYDEILFGYYATSVIMHIDMDKNKTMIGKHGVYSGLDPSPDGNYLLVQEIQKPYSYLVPYYRFPLNVEIWDTEGRPVKLVAEIPLAEYIPQGFGAVRTGPRSFIWRSDAPATLAW